MKHSVLVGEMKPSEVIKRRIDILEIMIKEAIEESIGSEFDFLEHERGSLLRLLPFIEASETQLLNSSLH